MKCNTFISILLILLINYPGYGQSGFLEYHRELSNVSAEYNSFIIPDELYAKMQHDLDDIRIIGLADQDTFEAPYFIRHNEDDYYEKSAAASIINESHIAYEHFYTFSPTTDTVINRINLQLRNKNFDYHVTLEGSQDQLTWYTILDNYRILSIENSSTSFRYTDLNFGDSRYKFYRVKIIDQNRPTLTEVRIKYSTANPGKYKSQIATITNVEQDRSSKTSIIDFSLRNLLPTSSVKISINEDSDYYRRAELLAVTDSLLIKGNWKYNYRKLAQSIVRSSSQTNTINFNTTTVQHLRLIIYNHDDEAIQINSIECKIAQKEIVFRKPKDASYFLAYGDLSMSSPVYDIARFENKIPLSLNQVNIGKEKYNNGEVSESPDSLGDIWLWVIMLMIAVVLSLATISMIRKSSNRPSS